MEDLEIIIPVKNENKNIVRVLDSFFYEVKTKFTVTICFDDYKDATIPEIKKYDRRQQFKIKLLKNKYYGINGAIKTAFENSSSKVLLVYPADDFFNADKIDKLNNLILNKHYDIVCPSRFMNGGVMYGCPFVKSILTRTANFIFYYILRLPTHDATNGFRIFSKKTINTIDLELQKGPTFSLQLLLKAHRKKYNITEIPVVWYERVIGKSNFKMIEWVLPYLKWLIYAINTALSIK
jgi:glycosyltransferase involved in cell wall biosynthesis